MHYQNVNSQPLKIPAGVPQGSILSPILYSLFTSDVPVPSNCTVATFADDTILMSAATDPSIIIRDLEKGYELLQNYFHRWKIKLNDAKTEAIFFTRRRAMRYLPQRELILSSQVIPWNNKLKYLGVILDPKLTFSHHINYICEKTNTLIKTLYCLINRKASLNTGMKLLLYKIIFVPVMTYASSCWKDTAKTYHKKLQIQQNKILKLMMNKPRRFRTAALHEITNTKYISKINSERYTNFRASCEHSVNPLIANLNVL